MIVIVGASRGIGKYLFERFREEGSEVIGTYNTTHSEAPGLSKVDITEFSQVAEWIEKEKPSLQQVSLVNCAGISYNSFAHKSDPATWKKVIDVNLVGTYNCIRAILPVMRLQKFGRIINFSSVVATKGTPGTSAYAASKAALWGMTKALAHENAILNITVNNINMGYSELGMIDQVPKEYLDPLIKQIPVNKLCDAADIFTTVQYLRDCAYITGTSIDVNGGLV